ncbi:DUF1129 family protein [Virgibacillus proomii]|jgi:uncharacterized membrane-anchored protein|uniref:DUF1129 family protein n=1 Tax=Virgibacillus proomii TaxID=84407 RepID=UPI000987B5D8|nr:DUF1129 family protein [Virgibacillus proomii]
MNANELISINNEKRNQLNEENLAFYEDMLVYIRTASNKSEQQTEEILLELLEHLIEAQSEGKTAENIFGRDPRVYCEELINELPKEKRKYNLLFATRIIIQVAAIFSIVDGVISSALYYFFHKGENTATLYLGSSLISFICFLLLLYIFIKLVFWWLKRSTFAGKRTKKWVEFLQAWIGSTIFILLFLAIVYLIPEFGPAIQIPTLVLIGIGLTLYIVSYLLRTKAQAPV